MPGDQLWFISKQDNLNVMSFTIMYCCYQSRLMSTLSLLIWKHLGKLTCFTSHLLHYLHYLLCTKSNIFYVKWKKNTHSCCKWDQPLLISTGSSYSQQRCGCDFLNTTHLVVLMNQTFWPTSGPPKAKKITHFLFILLNIK